MKSQLIFREITPQGGGIIAFPGFITTFSLYPICPFSLSPANLHCEAESNFVIIQNNYKITARYKRQEDP